MLSAVDNHYHRFGIVLQTSLIFAKMFHTEQHKKKEKKKKKKKKKRKKNEMKIKKMKSEEEGEEEEEEEGSRNRCWQFSTSRPLIHFSEMTRRSHMIYQALEKDARLRTNSLKFRTPAAHSKWQLTH